MSSQLASAQARLSFRLALASAQGPFRTRPYLNARLPYGDVVPHEQLQGLLRQLRVGGRGGVSPLPTAAAAAAAGPCLVLLLLRRELCGGRHVLPQGAQQEWVRTTCGEAGRRRQRSAWCKSGGRQVTRQGRP